MLCQPTEDQASAGFERVVRGIDELAKDIPKADTLLAEFARNAHSMGYLPKASLDTVLAVMNN